MNARKGPKVAADVPSGLDADRGIPLPEAVRARLTVTMGQPKKGLYFLRPAPTLVTFGSAIWGLFRKSESLPPLSFS